MTRGARGRKDDGARGREDDGAPAPTDALATDRAACLALAERCLDDGTLYATLAARVACRTESEGSDADVATLDRYLGEQLVPPLEAMGFACTQVPNPEGRHAGFLMARRVEDPALPTVLTYGHGDVVRGDAARWRASESPWRLQADGERWYGRGTADNKGQHSINLEGLQAALRARDGRLGFNCTVLMEMGEEAGSPGLRAVCEQRRDELAADLLVACDGPRVDATTPTIFLGSRGALNFALRIVARERAYHSGNWGGVLANPAVRLAHALATIADARGRLLVEALRPAPPTERLRELLRDIPVGGGADDPALDHGWSEPGLSAAERLYAWNSFEVLALDAGNAQRPVNAVPPSAVAHGQLRFVVGTPWQRFEPILRRHLDAHGFADVGIEIGMACAATRLDVDSPWVGFARESVARSTGRAVAVLPNLGGTLPNDVFADVLGLPTVWVPHSYPACGQHAPDEHLLVPIARDGLRTMAGLYWDLGEPSAPWFASRR